MKHVKVIGILILTVLFIVLIISLKCCGGNEVMEKEETYNGCDYFNGEILEKSEEYLIIKPTTEWTWKEAERVLIPVTQMRGDYDTLKISTPLFEGELSELKPGDKIRVAFNAKTMEWLGDDVRVEVVFMLYRLTD